MPLATKVTGSRIRPSRLRFARAASGGGTITFPASPLDVRVEIALGADPAADPATWSWLDITQWVRYDPGIQITYGRRDESSRVEASTCRLTLDNRDGRWVRRNPYGAYYGLLSKNTPIRIGANPGDGQHYRYFGFVNEWPTRWSDKSGTDSTVSVACAGILRRLQQAQGISSALYYTMSGISVNDIVPLHYLPMEEGEGATQFMPVSGSAVRYSGAVAPGSDSSVTGSKPLPTVSTGGLISAFLPGYTDTNWHLQFALNIKSKPSANAVLLEIPVNGAGNGVTKLQLVCDVTTFPGSTLMDLQALNSAGTMVADAVHGFGAIGSSPEANFYGSAHSVIVGMDPIGGGGYYVSFGITEEDPSFTGYSLSSALTGSAGIATSYTFKNTGDSAVVVGHAGLFLGAFNIFDEGNQNASALTGHAGEQAHVRGARLCREAGVSFTCTSATSALMGPQALGTLLDNLRACEAADMGVLYEHEFGLGYQSLDDRLNAQVQFALDFDQRHVADTPEPADDDQRLINSYTAGRSGGSSATISDPDSIATSGIFAGSGTFSLYADDQTLDVGGWKVHLGIVDEDRWPAIPIALHTTPDLIDAWTSLPYGARMTLANPPAEMAPDTLGAVIEGWTESIWPHRWEAVLNTAPASPYDVGKLAADSGDTDPFLGWLESDSCVLAADVDSTATSWQITADPVWTNTADDFPCDVRIGGEVVTITACSGTSAPQTWTVVRSVNGVVKAHTAAAAEPIELVHPIILVP